MQRLLTPIDAVIFDCDSTLCTIEGIDVLAQHCNVGKEVKHLTDQAMNDTGLNPTLYAQRLNLVRPTKEQVLTLGQLYIHHLTKDAQILIEILQRFPKTIYIVSAGLLPSLWILGQSLKVPRKNIFGVDIYFDKQGNYETFEQNSPLATQAGKKHIVEQIKKNHPQIFYVGDGLNDLSVKNSVARFVGFGGCVYRKKIQEACEYYIDHPTLCPLLPLILTQQEVKILTTKELSFYEKASELLFKA